MSKPPDSKGRTRGRPARSDRQIAEMRGRIRMAAQKLFEDEGYAAVSMRRLAKEAGCTVMTIYQYYDRKIDILRELWAEVFAELFDGLEAVAAAHGDPVARLEAISLGYVRFWLERRDRYFMVFMSSGVSQEDVSVIVRDEAVLGRFDLLRASLAEALGDRAAPADLQLSAELLLCTLNGIAHNLITISAYPWPQPDVLVGAAVANLMRL